MAQNPTIQKRNLQIIEDYLQMKKQGYTAGHIYRQICGKYTVGYELAKLIICKYNKSLVEQSTKTLQDVFGVDSPTTQPQKIVLEITIKGGDVSVTTNEIRKEVTPIRYGVKF